MWTNDINFQCHLSTHLISNVKQSKIVIPRQWSQFRSWCKNSFIFFSWKHTLWKKIEEKLDYWWVLLTNAERAEWHPQEIMSDLAQNLSFVFLGVGKAVDKSHPSLGLEKENSFIKGLYHQSVLQFIYCISLRTVPKKTISNFWLS